VDQRIDFAHVLNEFWIETGSGLLMGFGRWAGYIHKAYLGKGFFSGVEELGEPVYSIVWNFYYTYVRFFAPAVAADLGAQSGERVEDGCFARSRKSYQTNFHVL
jgi:hypothetical protein